LVPVGGHVIGITGPPGSGKSTLVDKLVGSVRAEGLTVAIIAVDPSSPFSGGALLGDRVRMMAHHGDPGVFIRSMAARRTVGGLAAATRDVARLLAAAGFDLILVETVGVGQSELDIVRMADSNVVVTVPGLGDSIQTLKAGLLEIADLFVVNMADRQGADRTVRELRSMLGLTAQVQGWTPPVLQTVASESRGIDELWAALRQHRQYLEASGEGLERRRQRTEAEIIALVQRQLQRYLDRELRHDERLVKLLAAAAAGEISPNTAAAGIWAAIGEEAAGSASATRPLPRTT
jgi:LAO/AO transport system kinase